MTSSKVITPKRQLVVAAVLLYGWFFYIDPLLDTEDQLGPEELEGYREELGAWVRDNEERLRQVAQSENSST